MTFRIKNDNILPLPNKMSIFSEVSRLEKLLYASEPYPPKQYEIIKNRIRNCLMLLWGYSEHRIYEILRYKDEVFQREVQYGNTIFDGRVYGNTELALFMDKQKAKISKDMEWILNKPNYHIE